MTSDALAGYEQGVLDFIARRLDAMGEEASGLYNYYAYRVRTGAALMAYETFFLNHLADERRVFHAGIGIGTLTIGLANCGVDCIGFEIDEKRYYAALAARDALLAPGASYEVRKAGFPAGLKRTDMTRDATLLFTNVGSGWSEEQTDQMIRSLHWFGKSYLDLRLFGNPRETSEEREALADRLRSAGLEVTPVATGIPMAYYVSVTSTAPAEPEVTADPPRRRAKRSIWRRIGRWARIGR